MLSALSVLSVLSVRLSLFLVAQRSFALPTGASASAMASSVPVPVPFPWRVRLEELQASMEGAVAAAQTSRGAAAAASTAAAAAAATAEDLAVKFSAPVAAMAARFSPHRSQVLEQQQWQQGHTFEDIDAMFQQEHQQQRQPRVFGLGRARSDEMLIGLGRARTDEDDNADRHGPDLDTDEDGPVSPEELAYLTQDAERVETEHDMLFRIRCALRPFTQCAVPEEVYIRRNEILAQLVHYKGWVSSQDKFEVLALATKNKKHGKTTKQQKQNQKKRGSCIDLPVLESWITSTTRCYASYCTYHNTAGCRRNGGAACCSRTD